MECPACHQENFPGADTCAHCESDLRNLDIPRPTRGLQRDVMRTPIGEVYPRAPLQVSSNAPVAKAIEIMQRNSQGCVLVVDEGTLRGILTERDLLQKAAGEDLDLLRTPVRGLMTENPVTLRDTDTLAFALNRLSVGGYRHLPVLREKDKTLAGFLSIRCMLKFLADRVL